MLLCFLLAARYFDNIIDNVHMCLLFFNQPNQNRIFNIPFLERKLSTKDSLERYQRAAVYINVEIFWEARVFGVFVWVNVFHCKFHIPRFHLSRC